jgi:hypothetical protein
MLGNVRCLGSGDAGPVTCSIAVDGKVLSKTTSTGRFAAANSAG